MKRVLIVLAVCCFWACSNEKEEVETIVTRIDLEATGSNVPPPPSDLGEGEEVFIEVEEIPSFPGGDKAMRDFLTENVNYPTTASRANVSGRVTSQFVIEKDGSIESVKVLKGIGFGCDEEAIRVIKSMPKWNPGMQNGKPVRVYFNLPIVFTLDK